MREKKIGMLQADTKLLICDPWTYDKYRVVVPAVAGSYRCYMQTDRIVARTKIATLGIYSSAVKPHSSKMIRIGDIVVESGFVGFFCFSPVNSESRWEETCDLAEKERAWFTPEGLMCSVGNTAKSYPVYATMNSKGQIAAMEIRF